MDGMPNSLSVEKCGSGQGASPLQLIHNTALPRAANSRTLGMEATLDANMGRPGLWQERRFRT